MRLLCVVDRHQRPVRGVGQPRRDLARAIGDVWRGAAVGHHLLLDLRAPPLGLRLCHASQAVPVDAQRAFDGLRAKAELHLVFDEWKDLQLVLPDAIVRSGRLAPSGVPEDGQHIDRDARTLAELGERHVAQGGECTEAGVVEEVEREPPLTYQAGERVGWHSGSLQLLDDLDPPHVGIGVAVVCAAGEDPEVREPNDLIGLDSGSPRGDLGRVSIHGASLPGAADRDESHAGYPSRVRSALPETRYARAGGTHIAYQVLGDGPVDVVLADQWFSHMDGQWDVPPIAEFRHRLGAFSRLIMFDKRGIGLSDPVPIDQLPTIEEWIDDLRAVMDEVGSSRAALVTNIGGAIMSLVCAAAFPDRLSSLVIVDGFARFLAAPDYPIGGTVEEKDWALDEIEARHGRALMLDLFAPSNAA